MLDHLLRRLLLAGHSATHFRRKSHARNSPPRWHCHRRPFGGRTELLEVRSLLTTFTVTTRFDIVDPGDSVLSLREALAAAANESVNPGHDTIVFDPGLGSGFIHADYTGFTEGTDINGNPALFAVYAPHGGGEFLVDSDVTIDGSALGLVRIGHERGWAERHRIFRVAAGVQAEFRNLVVHGGDSNRGNGGGIFNEGTLTVIDSVIGGNYALGDSVPPHGGGIYNAAGATMTLERTHVGEVALTQDFLTTLGIDGQFYASSEAGERARFKLFVYRGESVVGKSTTDPTQISGNGAYGNGGGIYNVGTMSITKDSVIRGNRTDAGSTTGAGIYNVGTLEIRDSTIEEHRRWGDNSGSAYGSVGAGIYNSGQIRIYSSVFRRNESPKDGGAIYNTGLMAVYDTRFEDNAAIRDSNQSQSPAPSGGAIYHAGGPSFIFRSSFTGNAATLGGAIRSAGGTSLTLQHVTMAENTAISGGGLYASSGPISIHDSTVAWNNANTGGGLYRTGSDVFDLQNTIVAENTATTGRDIRGTITSSGHNLIQTTAGYVIAGGAAATDLVGVQALISAAGDFGGSTATVALLAHSPAIDSGGTRTDSVDQRGFSGNVGARSDRGAFEAQPPSSLRVDSLEDVNDGNYSEGELTLREAIDWANLIPGADEISFAPDLIQQLEALPGTIAITGGIMRIQDDLSIYGPGADLLSISGGGVTGLFLVDTNVRAEFTDLKLTQGLGGDGGAIRSYGNLTLRRMHIADNESIVHDFANGNGGGVYSTGTLLVDSSTFENNRAASIGFGGGVYSSGQLTVVNSTFSANSAKYGGGISIGGTPSVDLNSSTIAYNTATTVGGGIYAASAAIHMGNSIVARNSSPDSADLETPSLISDGYNLIGDGTGSALVDGVNQDQVGTTTAPVNPLLGRLRLLKGSTPVHGLLPGSPAIENSNPTKAPRFDQRGVSRPVDALPDIGAFEYVTPVIDGDTVVVDTLDGFSDGLFSAGHLSLTEAIALTNDSPVLDRIVFSNSLFLTTLSSSRVISLDISAEITSGPTFQGLMISDDLEIVGPGADRLRLQVIGTHRVLTTDPGITVQISGLTMAGGNGAAAGGGLANYASLTLDGVHVTESSAGGGGGIFNAGTLTMRNSTISGSTVTVRGGALLNFGTAVLTNSTISGNHADQFGGGIYGLADSSTRLHHVTLTDNSSNTGGGIDGDDGARLTLINSILAGNTATTGHPDLADSGLSVLNQGGNVFGVNSGFGFPLQASDQRGSVSTPLIPLMTDLTRPPQAVVPMHALLPSPRGQKNVAVDAALNFWGLSTDQRGVARNTDGGFDSGAFEVGPDDGGTFQWQTSLIVDQAGIDIDGDFRTGHLTLPEAVVLANAFQGSEQEVIDDVAYDVIEFSDALIGKLAESSPTGEAIFAVPSGGLSLLDNVIIRGQLDAAGDPVVVLDGMHAGRVLLVSDFGLGSVVHAQIDSLTVRHGTAAGNGGGIFSYGHLFLTDSIIEENLSSEAATGGGFGGGISAEAGSLTMRRSTVRNNEALGGGGVLAAGTVDVNISQSTIESNTANSLVPSEAVGAGIIAIGDVGTLRVQQTTFSGNVSQHGWGGGLMLYRGGVIENSTFSGNTAASGGGLFAAGQPFGADSFVDVYNSTFTGNTATEGGGFYNASRSHLQIANSILHGNAAASGPEGRGIGPVTSLGYNIIRTETGFSVSGTTYTRSANDLINVDPLLGTLADNGGPARTHRLMPGSPAIDAGGMSYIPLTDQRGYPMADIAGIGSGIVDIGAYELQSSTRSTWNYAALDQSQFGPGDALVYGFGFDEGDANSGVRTDPYFLGFQFDTGPMTFGKIVDGPLGTKFGGELQADFSGKLGFNLGFYVNSGSVDVTYDGDVNYVIDPGNGSSAIVSAWVDVTDGSLYTISPKLGAYADVVIELDADVSARAALFGVVEADLIDIHVAEVIELFSLNRQMRDDYGRPLFLTDNGTPVARDSGTGVYYSLDVSPVVIPDPGPAIP
ncbi:MAG: hypothetical protein KDA96_00410, partial [Planctomycetaceae bacterium]|nr:hypothetical protein [Planctomycetaceae bacterium]